VSVAESTESGRGTVARNALYLLFGQVTTTALGVLYSAALGRSLGASDFGLYFLIASFATFAYVLADWGQGLYMIREVARQPERGSLLLGTALLLRTAGSVLVIIPAGLAVWALGYDTVTCWYSVAFIAVSLPFFLAQTYGIVFRARDRMGLDAWVSVANKIALLVITLVLLFLGRGLPGVLAAQAVAGILALVMAIRLYSRVTTGPLRSSTEIARLMLAGGTAPLAFAAMNSIQPYIDAAILSKMAPGDVIGWYGAAKNILGTILAPALILGTASFPSLARAASDEAQFKAEIRSALRPLQGLGMLAAVGAYLFADDAIAIVYGHRNFGPAGIVMQVYAPCFFMLFTNILFGISLFSLDRAKAYSALKVASVVVCTALELVFIPYSQAHWGNGGIGVAAATLASEFVVSGGVIFLLWRKALGLDIFVDTARALAAAVLTLLLFWSLPPLPFLVGVPLCLIAFLTCSAVFGLVRRSDIELVQAFVRKKRLTLKSQTG
jgi:O-antigen/teichoic acid export membrane protein